MTIEVPSWLLSFVVVASIVVSVAIVAGVSLLDRRKREAAPESNPRVIGLPCVECGTNIVTELEGGLCRTCESPVHRRCARAHRLQAHVKRSGYR